MKRREFIGALAGAAAAWPLAARAQPTNTMPKIGVLMSTAENSAESRQRIAAFQQGLTELGWKDGENVRIEYRWGAGDNELFRQFAAELVALRPSVLLANGTPTALALKKVTDSIPVVCAQVQDPVGLGLVKSLARPGGNVTGFTFVNPELIGKWIGLLQQAAPTVTRAALMFNPSTTPFFHVFLREIEATRERAGIELTAMPVGTPGEIETAIAELNKDPGGSLIVPPDPFNIVRIKQIAQLVAQARLPAISVYRPFAIEGGLMAYGPDVADIFRRSAGYVDRILKGANPAELPMQQPDKFEFVINLKAARSLDLTIPPTLLATADEVIE
jgi:putative ABC transport system substrate-binding protein